VATEGDIRTELLKSSIEELNGKSQRKLNKLLLDEFEGLGIKYEEAQLVGKAKKRGLVQEDINRLEPFHWGYHFNQIIAERGGFDAIIANPPWEVFKPIAKEFCYQFDSSIERRGTDIKVFEKRLSELLEDQKIKQDYLKYQSQFPFVSAYYRSAEQYRNQISTINGKKAGTDINLYKLFLEQCFNLLHHKGRCGIIIPTGLYSDLGTTQLREMLFCNSKVDTIFGISNERFLFEGVDHRVKFCLLTFEKGGSTNSFKAAFRINPREAVRPKDLGYFLNADSEKLNISTEFIRKLSPDSFSVMEFKSELDIQVAAKLIKFPLIGEKLDGVWNINITSEFHMTNDSDLFRKNHDKEYFPLLEGKMVSHFDSNFSDVRYWINSNEGRSRVLGRVEDKGQILDYQRYRFAYRSITGSTNKRTMLCGILPKNVFCGNSLNVSKHSNESISNIELLYFSAVMSSFIVDFSLRQRVGSQLNIFFVKQTSVPRLQKGDRPFQKIVERAAKLICTTPEFDDLAAEAGLGSHANGITDEVQRAQLRAELDGIIAHLYHLTETEFAHILQTFPIVPEATKIMALNAYRDVERGLI
jgi:hypothetical protein